MSDEQIEEAARPPVVPVPVTSTGSDGITSLSVTQTEYVILVLDKSEMWKVVGQNVTARSAEVAIRTYAEKVTPSLLGSDGVSLVAVPARSWKPVKVATKTTTSLVIEDAQ